MVEQLQHGTKLWTRPGTWLSRFGHREIRTERRESTREDNLMSRESHRVSILTLVRGSKTPRVERGRVEGGGVLGGELYVDGERGMRVVLPQWTSPPAARLY